MDMTTINREIETMAQGLDPATVRETIRIQMERKARFGLVSVVCMMLGLGAIGLLASGEDPSMQAELGPEMASGAEGVVVASHADAAVATDAPLLWFTGADTLTTAAATRDTQLTGVPGSQGTH